MTILKELSNDLDFTNEVETLAQSLYRNLKQFNGQDVPIAKCWVLAVDSIISNKGLSVSGTLRPPTANVIKLRGRT